MNLFPAIDLRDGKVVRLRQGNFAAETVYGDDALHVARSFAKQGAPWIHVVDLDAARTGTAVNSGVVAQIVRSVDIPVQSGGGVRDRATAEALLATGVSRIVIGTLAVKDPDLVKQLAAEHPGCVAVGLDARKGLVATEGWVEGSTATVTDLVRNFDGSDIAAFVVTDIERDGMLGGPDIATLSDVIAETSIDVIASGGVSTLADLHALADLSVSGRKLAGVIVGKALYENRFNVTDAIAACQSQQ